MTDEQRALMDELGEINPEALLADGFEDAFIGIAHQGYTSLACYDYTQCVELLMRQHDMSEEEADDYMSHSVLGYADDYTPVFLDRA
jgi:hypothetical protein